MLKKQDKAAKSVFAKTKTLEGSQITNEDMRFVAKMLTNNVYAVMQKLLLPELRIMSETQR